ncbi:MG406 family protein [Mycoplasma sp. HU2014]|uniref:MG406 family protein n=1 Tax=Mycoplasma sp. HU2014 TaxID=1664275 RepID=UPI00067C4BCE|nr:MG406 family protein [Mycoplasma sp. HU2014]KNG79295.1 membrane protein [Mycoplasma sp. HU2014]
MLKQALSRNLTKITLIVNLLWISFFVIVFAILVGTRTIAWNWLTGLILGQISSILGLIILFYTRELMIKYENPFLFCFMFLIRIGLYVIPFFLSLVLYDGKIFNYLSILIGLTTVFLLPISSYLDIKNKKRKGEAI